MPKLLLTIAVGNLSNSAYTQSNVMGPYNPRVYQSKTLSV